MDTISGVKALRNPMKIGYLRVSTKDQCEDRQVDALRPICDALHIEKLSATAKQRPIYEDVLARLGPGDVFVVWDLDRAWRSAKDALIELDRLRGRGVIIQIASLSLDTATPHGKLLYTFISGLAEFERALLSERTKQGLEAARRRGKRIGRPPKISKAQIRAAQRTLAKNEATIAELAARNGVHPWTLRRRIAELENSYGTTTPPKNQPN